MRQFERDMLVIADWLLTYWMLTPVWLLLGYWVWSEIRDAARNRRLRELREEERQLVRLGELEREMRELKKQGSAE